MKKLPLTTETSSSIVTQLMNGKPLTSICKSKDMPSLSKVYNWIQTDKDFANKILHPRYNIMRKYYAYTKEELSIKNIAIIKKGIYLSKKERVSAHVKRMGFEKGKHKWRIILNEGKNREIRRIFHRFDIKVYNLHRYAFGKLTLKDIDRGKSKKISETNIKKLFNI